LTWLESEK
jgi:hypothetical protein